MIEITPEQILRLADAHIKRFDRLLQKARDQESMAGKLINIGDCQHYKSVWGSIKAKGGVVAKLSRQERGEIKDAIDSGDYAGILTITEPEVRK